MGATDGCYSHQCGIRSPPLSGQVRCMRPDLNFFFKNCKFVDVCLVCKLMNHKLRWTKTKTKTLTTIAANFTSNVVIISIVKVVNYAGVLASGT